ncbi:MobA/MobL family protein [Marinospirillum insulare]|uniref:MobA/MobL protein domain-containing protein n=1 Tax=Marinospirillum insulare TaxID=217169 RepID=A0ABQ5ZX62_9GAMM|nr:MobA/MobL family protein [Marinospirillum insulare]GLR63597.1 hypothetical protein GCM10007878_10320 [Marinospirillum insulare]
MAIFHFHARVVQRSKGKSAVAAAAYRSGTTLVDKRTGKTYDYTDKNDIDGAFIFGWAGCRDELWNTAEATEKRKDSTVAREYIVALPRELDPLKRQALAIELAEEIFIRYGVAVDLCLHGAKSKNPHAHFLTTTREACSTYYELGNKSIVDISNTARKERSLLGYKQQLDSLKSYWCELVNKALELNGFDEEITHRSFKARGILNRKPQIKTYGNPKRVAVNNIIKEYNEVKDELDSLYHEIYLEKLEREKEYQRYLEDVEPPDPEPINLPQSERITFVDQKDDTLSASDRLMAEFEAEWVVEDAANEAAENTRVHNLSGQANNRNNEPGL